MGHHTQYKLCAIIIFEQNFDGLLPWYFYTLSIKCHTLSQSAGFELDGDDCTVHTLPLVIPPKH
jgi:hypothetical protein